MLATNAEHPTAPLKPIESLKFTQDQLTANSKFDRSHEYDHMGRVTKALSGAEARGGGATNDRPYNETLAYDAFDHLTTLDRKNWDRVDGSGPSSFVNNRVTGFTYDADGRVTGADTGGYTYDAAGRVIQFGDSAPYQTDQVFTGEGKKAKTTEKRFDDDLDQFVTEKITYYLTSSVLGGALVTELSETGATERTLVHAGGSVIASQIVSSGVSLVEWEHTDASGASRRTTSATGESSAFSGAFETDAVGANAGLAKPFTWSVPDKEGLPALYPGVADMLTNPGGGCTMERMPIPCAIRNSLVAAGATTALVQNNNGVLEEREVRSFGVGLWGLWHEGRSGNSSNDMVTEDGQDVLVTNNSFPGWWEFQYSTTAKQNSTPFDRGQIKQLVTETLGKGSCAEFAKSILDSVNSRKNPALAGGNLAKIFEIFSRPEATIHA